ncbi:SapC protein [Alteromonadaceae bacterium Bs31]|nr:SapC protein [Alteromonadaceae bacterium Bs31]
MFYQEPVALEKKKHVDLKLDRKQNYAYAANVNSVPLGGVEFFQASRDFPVLFIKNSKDEYMPMAILSLKESSHDMGDDWENTYVPAFVRRYPFVLTPEKVVMFDAKAPHFASGEGDALFKAEDEPTDTLKEIVNFLEAVDGTFKRTEEFTKAVAEKELFEPYKATVKFENGQVRLDDLYVINEKKLHETLDKDTLFEWFNKGWIAWTHAHLHSLGAIPQIILRQRKAQQKAEPQATA